MKIVAISDVHGKWNKLSIPDCDILISAGDFSFKGEPHMVRDFHKWLSKQDAGHIISVMGNHELWVESNFNLAKQMVHEIDPTIHFLEEGLVEIEGIKIYGSAIQPTFFNWAYNRNRGQEIAAHWARIPDDTNILITHGPMYGILDMCPDGSQVGCQDLFARHLQLENLKLHICGHIHYSAGEKYFNGVKYINAAICDEQYMPTNPVRIIEWN
jgi:Icc-related predicted phosphoesterase